MIAPAYRDISQTGFFAARFFSLARFRPASFFNRSFFETLSALLMRSASVFPLERWALGLVSSLAYHNAGTAITLPCSIRARSIVRFHATNFQ